MRILKSSPVLTIVNSYLVDSPQPSTISYLWNFGSLLGLCLVSQIVSGILLAMHYQGSASYAFASVEHEMNCFFLIVFLRNLVLVILNSFEIHNSIQNILSLNHNSDKLILNPKQIIVNNNDRNFYEWFRGLVDGEGCFYINVKKNKWKEKVTFSFTFSLYMHKDDAPMINSIAQKLNIGSVRIGSHFVSYIIENRMDLLKIFDIFDETPLNTSKNLNYLAFKKAYYLWCKRNIKESNLNICEEILNIKNSMNRKRTFFEQPKEHQIIITNYWLLGFVEGEGHFCIKSKVWLEFGLSQTKSELLVMEAIKNFLLKLPGSYIKKRKNSNVVRIFTDKKPKNIRSNPVTKLSVNDLNYIKNVIIPFFDNLIWFSKKELDYKDWKLIFNIVNQGKHFTNEGKELISFINKRMNTRRLSTNLPFILPDDIESRIKILLNAPSNYKIHTDGRIYINSEEKFLKGRGNLEIELYSDKGIFIKSFNSIKECALTFKTSERTINRRLDSGNIFMNNNEYFLIKRINKLP